jgi:hypothetical protein
VIDSSRTQQGEDWQSDATNDTAVLDVVAASTWGLPGYRTS